MEGSGYKSTGYGARGTPFLKYPGVHSLSPTEIKDPFSGCYGGNSGDIVLDMEVDLDQIHEFSPVLNMLSGTLLDKNKSQKLWTGDSTAAHFRSQKNVKVVTSGEKRGVKCVVAATLNNGNKLSGELTVAFSKSQNEWQGTVNMFFGSKRIAFDTKRTSKFFREVNLDLDYTDKVIWPTVELQNLSKQPLRMKNRKLDPFSAFEDAGIKLDYNSKNGNKVEDPTEYSPWSKSDLYEVMSCHFDEATNVDSNIWCMMGTTPPDKRYMGFSFDRKGQHGFALFTGHSSFNGLESDDTGIRNLANRRLLHYFVHECGHCLGLAHPFEKENPDSLSWMNYAWKYDDRHKPGSFYDQFEYRFSDKELEILRHSPGKNFKQEAPHQVVRKTVDLPYGYASFAPDREDSDDSSESEDEYPDQRRVHNKKPLRKLELRLKMREASYPKGKLVDYEIRVKNIGKLPALVDSDLSVAGGNLRLYVSDQNEVVQIVEPYVRPIHSSYTSPIALYTANDDEGPDRYSDYGSIGEGKDGAIFDKVGIYTVRARYSAGRYDVTSENCTVEITEPEFEDEEEKETYSQISEMAELGGSSHDRFTKAFDFFRNLSKAPTQTKKEHVPAMIAVFDGLSKSNRNVGRSMGKRRKITENKAKMSSLDLLKDTADVIQYFKEQGKKEDNQQYARLVMVRASLYVRENNIDEAEQEINQLYGDLLGREVKFGALKSIRKMWMKLKNRELTRRASFYYQEKVLKVLNWRPRKFNRGEKDITGLGLGTFFSDFNDEHKKKANIIYKMLQNKYEETQDVVAVMKFANALQQSREANEQAVKYAVKGFIVHTRGLRKLGIRYPDPPLKDPSYEKNAAMTRLVRSGPPNEDWMNYWRSDADFNFHHEHWHIVYSNRRPGPHLEKRGELFGYMHAQMVARYDAERESWGLQPVKPLDFDERFEGFNAGFEFNEDFSKTISERIGGKLKHSQITELTNDQNKYIEAMKNDTNNEYDANWSGEVLEATIMGKGLHNNGHNILGGMVTRDAPVSYMRSAKAAVRDPIFFRWHKRIDNLWQANNNRLHIKIDDFKAPITLAAYNVIISSSEIPSWESTDSEQVLKTYLRKPTKKYEHDDKLDHEPFYYHIKAESKGRVKCTFRIFICPERHANERIRWIEMDKFVQTVDGTTLITRRDKESSVIKKESKMFEEAQENNQVDEVNGWCDCGLPYQMLLPRGTRSGENYLVCIIATNNAEDNLNARTTCGSMSYCGTKGIKYPDARQMGFPFTNNFIDGDSRYTTVLEALRAQSHIALKPFVIQNQPSWRELEKSDLIDESPSLPATLLSEPIWPNRKASSVLLPESTPRLSARKGNFRVILRHDDIDWNFGKSKPRVVFNGRGKGNGEYTIKSAEIALLEKDTKKTDPSRRAPILVGGNANFTVPEQGLTTDAVSMGLGNLGDYAIKFNLDSPGCYVKVSDRDRTNTVVDSHPESENDYGKKRSPHVYCVSKIIL